MNKWNNGQPVSRQVYKKNSKKRLAPHELQVYHVEGLLTWYKCDCDPKTGDRDYHLVIQSDSGAAIIAKIPDPQCVSSKSPFYQQIQTARATMENKFKPVTGKKSGMVKVAVEGPAFFDIPHGQLGRADNSVEIHPVLSLKFFEKVQEMKTFYEEKKP